MAQKLLQYDVIGKLGEGAKSTIYAVKDPATGRKYAMKHVVRKDDKDVRFVEQMQAEFDASKAFAHSSLRKNYELKINKTLFVKITEAFLLMELVEGQTLDKSLPPDLPRILDMFVQVAQGLKQMHAAGYVHCDIKPINIMITTDGAVKVIDFGQSCKVGTIKDRIQGTPDYIAPEQVVRKPVTPQTDIFNLGATLYWALTGKTIPTLYTVGKGGENSLLSHDLIRSPMELNPAVPEMLSKFIMECIATSPTKRPAAMDAFIQKLEVAKHILTRQSSPNRVPHPVNEAFLDEED